MPVPVFNDAVRIACCPESTVDGDALTVIAGSLFTASDPVPVVVLVTPSESVTVTLTVPLSAAEDAVGLYVHVSDEVDCPHANPAEEGDSDAPPEGVKLHVYVLYVPVPPDAVAVTESDCPTSIVTAVAVTGLPLTDADNATDGPGLTLNVKIFDMV